MIFCDRCKHETPDHLVSMFNADLICSPCQRLEKEHSQFEKATQAVIDSVSKGDYEFEGIGLPENLEYKGD